jgi:beta-glucosidase
VGSAPAGELEVGPLIQFNLQPAYGSDAAEIAAAVALAAAADVAVVVVGTTEEVESEGFDRTSLALPGAQDELVRAVAAANPRTVVVVNAGAPVLLPWVDDVAAVLLAWFPGQEFGNALADVLFGAVEPGGRLPVTWPAVEDGLPGTRPVDGQLHYDEGLFIGYRWYEKVGREPAFRFGHGLGYTTWEFAGLEAPATAAAGKSVEVRVRVRNAGERAGREVVQVYASRPGGTVERAARWLAGFAVVDAVPGEEATAVVTIPARALEHWDDTAHAWTLEAGTFVLEAGRSSGDLRLAAEVVVG